MVVTPIRTIANLSMEQGYWRIVRRYPNNKIRVTETRYPYGTKFRGLVYLHMYWISVLYVFLCVLYLNILLIYMKMFLSFIAKVDSISLFLMLILKRSNLTKWKKYLENLFFHLLEIPILRNVRLSKPLELVSESFSQTRFYTYLH